MDSQTLHTDASPAETGRAQALRVRRLQPLANNDEDLRRAEWKKRIGSIHVNTTTAIDALKEFRRLALRPLAGGEGQALILAAPSGAGKTHLLFRLARLPNLQPSHDEFGPLTPLVWVIAPSPCTLKSLGKAIYRNLTGNDLKKTTTEEVWRLVAYQLYQQGTSILVIDEFHHVLGSNDQTVVNTLKNLLLLDHTNPFAPPDVEPYPLQLVLSGMRTLERVVGSDLQLARRARRISIEPVPPTKAGLRELEKFIRAIEQNLGFPDPSDLSTPDMIRRFWAASNGYLGRTMHLIKIAADLAIDQGSTRIDQHEHLAKEFERITRLPAKQNPFIVADISSFKAIPEKVFDRLTRLRGNSEREADKIDVQGDDL